MFSQVMAAAQAEELEKLSSIGKAAGWMSWTGGAKKKALTAAQSLKRKPPTPGQKLELLRLKNQALLKKLG